MVTWSPVLLSLFQWENKNVDLIALGSLIFNIQIQISSDLLCPIIPILRHPTLPHLSMKEFSPEEPKCLKQVVVIVQVLGWLVPVSVRKLNLYVKKCYAPVGGGGDNNSASSLECELASNSRYELAGNI